ncbi:ABC transporter permease [Sphaerisporangium sp. TRM90804]|uniref:ABC transporter permease n=1 Tax=Sphaerisporangium sp. TRM90804 TaxID=3031113 RepID=UPI00244697DD|nr:ABC transporter permease [Sphaerisporangium sp. TRM90804]MDH2424356.1 ABC transporter permease [Sphaerisporangium sp. TRM90804]
MTRIAWHTLKARWASFAGSFAALSLGVALFAAAGLTLAAVIGGPVEPPRWYVTPSVVVAGPDGGGVTTRDPDGPAANPGLPPGERGFVPEGAAGALSAVEGVAAVVVDRAGYAGFGGATEAHPWTAAALHPYRMTAGGPPTGDGEVVLTAPAGQRPGDAVVVATADGPRRFVVSGVVETGAPPALYVTEATAARLAGGRVAAVALLAAPGAAPEAIAGRAAAVLRGEYPHLRVLTGDDRRSAEPDPDAGLLVATVSLVGSTAGLAGFVAAFVVAGTFAFTVAQRRREFALLRTAGATPRQVRRLVLGEAALVGVLAGAAGCALSAVLAPAFARWLGGNGLAPAGFTTGFAWWPPVAAAGLGLVVALAGAGVAARRAGAVRPIEALREAAAEHRGMTATRWVFGLALPAGVIPIAPFLATPEGGAYLLVVVMLLILGCALLLPVLMRPFAWALTPGRGPIAVLARAGVRAESRRYASAIAPVLVTVGLAGASLAGTETISAAQAAGLRAQLTAPLLVVPAGEARLPDTVARAVEGVPGVTAAARTKATTVFDAEGGTIKQRAAWYVDGPAAARVLRLPPRSGSFGDLTGETVAVSSSMAAGHGWKVGDRAGLWLNDGAQSSPRVVAVLDDRLGMPDVLLPWSLAAAHSAVPLPDSVYLALAPGADRAAVEAAVVPLGGAVEGTGTHLAALDERFDRLSRLSLLAILGMALVYTAIAIANTQLMATTGRLRELLTLRLAGATRRQILALVGREALTVSAVGALFGALVTGATLTVVHAALSGLADSVPTRVPWPVLLAVTASCTMIAFTASVIPASVALRRTARG